MPERNNSVTALLINFLKATGRWNDYEVYEFGDTGTGKIKKTGGSKEKDVYRNERLGHVSKQSKQITIKRNSQLLWNQEVVEKIDRGNLVHDILKRVTYVEDIEKVLLQSLNEGIIDSSGRQLLQVELTALLRSDQIAKYFKLPYKVMNERAVWGLSEAHIPDRVVTNNDECVIIDYKTGIRRAEDITQLKQYISHLKEFGAKEVKGFLLYTEGKIVEEIG